MVIIQKTTFRRLEMKLTKTDENEAAYQMLRMTGLVVRATEEKSTSTNDVTLVDT